MTPPLYRRLVAGIIGLLLPACAKPAQPPDTQTFLFSDDAGSSAWVQRVVGRDGSETLHGETSVVSGAFVTHVVEDADLDAGGRLVRAEIRIGADGAPEQHVVLDFERQAGSASTPAGLVAWPVPADAPWVYGQVARGVSTPIAAWITLRAAEHAAMVRVVQFDARSSYRTVPDQLAIPTELGTTVVLGGDAADVDAGFVNSVRLLDRGINLRRREQAATLRVMAHAP
jgi:hypothetical protein